MPAMHMQVQQAKIRSMVCTPLALVRLSSSSSSSSYDDELNFNENDSNNQVLTTTRSMLLIVLVELLKKINEKNSIVQKILHKLRPLCRPFVIENMVLSDLCLLAL